MTLNGTVKHNVDTLIHDVQPETSILPVDEKTTSHRLGFEVAEYATLANQLGAQVGDEFDIALRVKVTAVQQRTGYLRDTELVTTTTVKPVALHAIDEEPEPLPTPSPIPPAPAKVVTVDRVPGWAVWLMGSGVAAWAILAIEAFTG